MAQIALPRQQVTQAPQSAAVGSPLYQRRRTSNAGSVELLPNPDFTFPQRAPDSLIQDDSTSASNARPMSLQPYPAGRRGSSHALRQKSVSALPDFSFNPAGPPKQPTTTPPHSPLVSPTTPSRPVGHRRGGSEFIGGDGKTGGAATLLSSSPTKTDGMMAGNLRPGPPAGRRGHAHRRSGAISSHDLSAIMRPSESIPHPRAGSAPVTPLDGDQFVFGHSVNKSVSQPSLRDAGFFPEDPNSSPRRPPSRARVGFSDKVEYIRPLSTISSETETSLSTIRCHSATGSLSSIISAGTSSPASARGRPSLSTTMENEGRPSTAGAVLDMYKPQSVGFGGDVLNRKRPSSAVSPASPDSTAIPPSPQILAKRRGFFRFESRRGDGNVPSLPTSASDPALSASLDSPLSSPMTEDESVVDSSEKSKSTSRKSHRKPRKVKSWANSIISRKGKSSSKSKRKAQMATQEAVDVEDSTDSEDFDFEANFDVDNTVTIVNEDDAPARKPEPSIASWKPRELKRVDSDIMNPVIDLDAALGPFNTPHGTSPRNQQRGFGAHRRAMHSAGGLVQNHRRTESAPELVPFELRATTVGTTSAMADVFEEEEPEEDTTDEKDLKSPSSFKKEDEDEDVEEPKIQVVEAAEKQSGPAINWTFNDGLGIKRTERTRSEHDTEPLSPLQVPRPFSNNNGSQQSLHVSPVEVVEDYEEPRTSSLTHSSDSTVTPQLSIHEAKDAQPIMKIPLPLPEQSLRTPDTFASSFSSPDFRSSQASLDTPRLGTAASSVTDYRAMPSPHFGEPGPELRVSVDDVPSLTSSRSTMTNHFPLMSPRRPGERSSSLCSAPSEIEQRRRKRSSIASLSRLINSSSFGEKSKLSIEQRPHSEYLEPAKDSKKKHKRLSKLMQFWKSKDSSRT